MNKGTRSKKAKIVRASLSLPDTLLVQAQSRAAKMRPFTFSNYVATLIERDIAAAK